MIATPSIGGWGTVLLVVVAATLAVRKHYYAPWEPGAAAAAAAAAFAAGNRRAVRVATWNLRVPFPTDAALNLTWPDRRHSVAAAIARYGPDVLALQEDCYFMNAELLDESLLLPGVHSYPDGRRQRHLAGRLSDRYERYGLFNRNGESYPTGSWPPNPFTRDGLRDGEHNSIWWDRNRFDLLDTSSFWLSDRPDRAGTSFGEVTGRIVNCALLRDRRNDDGQRDDDKVAGKSVDLGAGRKVLFCSAHMPADNITRQLSSVDVLAKRFHRYQDRHPDALLFVAGDFNSGPSSATYLRMTETGFADTRKLQQQPNEEVDGISSRAESIVSTNDWNGGDGGRDELLDYIWLYVGTTGEGGAAANTAPKRGARPSQSARAAVLSVDIVPIHCCRADGGASAMRVPKTGRVRNRTASDHMLVMANMAL